MQRLLTVCFLMFFSFSVSYAGVICDVTGLLCEESTDVRDKATQKPSELIKSEDARFNAPKNLRKPEPVPPPPLPEDFVPPDALEGAP